MTNYLPGTTLALVAVGVGPRRALASLIAPPTVACRRTLTKNVRTTLQLQKRTEMRACLVSNCVVEYLYVV
jgi:hypothetical protein